MARYVCSQCGIEHEEWPLDMAFEYPDAYGAVPEHDRKRRVAFNGDLCVVDNQRFYVRGVLPIPANDTGDEWRWGVWAQIDEENFRRYLELWNSDAASQEPPFPGRLDNSIPGYPESGRLPLAVQLQPNNQRPRFTVTSETHSLGQAQRQGFPLRHFHALAEVLLTAPISQNLHAPGDYHVLQHYLRTWGRWGAPKRLWRRATIPSFPGPIFAARFAVPTAGGTMWIYATIGMSRIPQHYPIDDRGNLGHLSSELYMYAYEERDDLADALMDLAGTPFAMGEFIGPGHRIHKPGGGLVRGTRLEDALLLHAWAVGEPEEFSTLVDHAGRHVNMLCVVPLYSSETRFAQKNSSQALFKLMADKGVDQADLRRRPVV